MPYHLLQRREDKAQIFYQPDERFTLRFRSCVGRPAVPVQSANVADADRPMVPTCTMRSVESNISSRFYRTVETDDEMITDRTKTTLTMPAVDVGSGKILSRTSGGTVDDDRVFHGRILLSCLQTAREITPNAIASSLDSWR